MATGSRAAQVVWVEGEKVPLMVQKSDGGFGYGTTDMAALRQRVRDERGEWLIYVVDEGQAGHFKRAPPRPRSAWRRRAVARTAVAWPYYTLHMPWGCCGRTCLSSMAAGSDALRATRRSSAQRGEGACW